MKIVIAAAFAVLAFTMAGCQTAPVDYSPTSTMIAKGAVQVGDFRYLPALNGKVKPNQLRNTALGPILLTPHIDTFYRDAVFKELRFVGVNISDSKVQLSGDIVDFLVDDLGFSVDWKIDVKYVVKNASGTTIYEGEKFTNNNTAKFANAFQVLNTQIRLNIEELLKDPAFIKAIN
jgi:hypothetical protein